MNTIKDKYAIAGIGYTGCSINSGQSETHMALSAIMAAIDDAGLKCSDIDGIIGDHPVRVDAMTIGSALGLKKFATFIETDYAGGGVAGGLLHAIVSMEAGRSRNVVCYKSINGASKVTEPGMTFVVDPYELGFIQPFGLLGSLPVAALAAKRHMHEYGTRTRHFEAIARTCRKNAVLNPDALMYNTPFVADEYENAIIVADPLRRLDCQIRADGAAACVVTSVERAKDLKQPPVYVAAAAQCSHPCLSTGTKDPTLMENETTVLARQLFSMAGLGPADIDVLQIYDDFTPFVIMALEDLGFCKKGEGGDFADSGVLAWPEGDLPLNTAGGNLSEGCLDGFTHIVEAVKQLRGTSAAQVENAQFALVCGQSAVPTSGLILRR